MFKIIVALDPGGTTGWIIARINTVEKTYELIAYGMFPTWTGLIPMIEWKLTGLELDEIICEDYFVMNAMTSGNKVALETIGAIKFWAKTHFKQNVEFILQTPATRSFVDKRFDTPYPYVISHSRSALQHSIARAYKTYGVTKFITTKKAVYV